MTPEVTERQQPVGGAVAFLPATACLVSLPMLGVGGELGRVGLGHLTVALFVAGAVSVGKSERQHV